MNITPLFSVPIARLSLPEANTLNPQLRALLLEREVDTVRNPKASMTILPGLFESRFDLFSWPEACIQTLHAFCMRSLFALVGELNGYSQQELMEFESQTHAWFHITRRGGWFPAHNHPMASWSGVYCVAPGQNDADQPRSGMLHFQNPHQLGGMFIDPANSKLNEAYTTQGRNIRLNAGDLVLFPSWLFHEVFPFHGNDERITIAFNCWFRRMDGQGERGPYLS